MAMRPIRDYAGSLEEQDPVAVQAFDAEFGGRLREHDGALRWYLLRYWDFTKKLRRKDLYKRCLNRFHFDFVEVDKLNAFASSRNGVNLVACFTGAFTNITSFFTLLLSHPEVLPSVGNASDEKRWIRSLRHCNWSSSWSDVLANIDVYQTPPPSFPIDPTRKLFAHRLSILAMDFLFFHEIGHLVNGHLELLRGSAELGALEEASFTEGSSLIPLDYQALELNADSHAVIAMTPELLALPEVLPPTSTFETGSEAIESLVLAMLSVFILFDRTASSLKRYDSARHPHPAVRLANVHHGTVQLAAGFGPETQDRLRSSWSQAFDQAEQMCSCLGVGASVWHAAEHEGEATIEAFARTAKHFALIDKKLRPDLGRF